MLHIRYVESPLDSRYVQKKGHFIACVRFWNLINLRKLQETPNDTLYVKRAGTLCILYVLICDVKIDLYTNGSYQYPFPGAFKCMIETLLQYVMSGNSIVQLTLQNLDSPWSGFTLTKGDNVEG